MLGSNFYDRRFYFITSLAGMVIFYSLNNICYWDCDIYNHYNNRFLEVLDVEAHLLFYKICNLRVQINVFTTDYYSIFYR